jgi:predicted nucleic acid-binding protein
MVHLPRIAAGGARTSTSVPALVDTNVLVYSYDARFPEKRRTATALLRKGIQEDSVRIPHQAIVEFVATVTRPLPTGDSILTAEEARRQAEEFLAEFVVLYPNEAIVRTALRGMAAYRLSWFDAHLWAYADYYGLTELISEDFQPGRLYGTVRAVNPF